MFNMSTQPTQEQIEKVQKLLNLAHGAGTEGEAQSAFAAASKLMTKFGIEQHMLGKKEEPTFQESNIEGKWSSKRPAHEYVRNVILMCYHVQIIRQMHMDGTYTYFMIGTRADCIIAQQAFEVLTDVYPKLFKKWLRERGLDKTQALRNGYFQGLSSGFKQAHKEAQEQQMRESNAQSYAIVLVDKAKALTQFLATRKDITYRKSQQRQTDHSAFHAGVQQGRQIKVSRPLSGGSNAAQLK
jgi:hypothetical protein